MKKGLTEIVFILDKSGSMQSIKNDAIGGFNSFVEEQMKLEGETKVSLVLFNHNVQASTNVLKLTEQTYQPSGMTALLDAIGTGIDELENRLSGTHADEQPENVIFAIMTDGHENMSKEYTVEVIKNKIENLQKEKDYQFIFLGANIDAVSTAKSFGIRGDYAGDFVASSGGTSQVLFATSDMVSSYRSQGTMKSYADAFADVDMSKVNTTPPDLVVHNAMSDAKADAETLAKTIADALKKVGDTTKESGKEIGEALKSVGEVTPADKAMEIQNDDVSDIDVEDVLKADEKETTKAKKAKSKK